MEPASNTSLLQLVLDFGLPMVALTVAYLLGAIPFGLMIGKARGVDIRTMGSKNIGATNVFRCVGAKFGILAFVLDMLKGVIGTLCGFLPTLLIADISPATTLLLRVLCGTAAMLGHMFPVYLGFKGGKGVSTALGLLFGVAPLAGLLGFAGWGVIFVLSRYVSLASCLAGVIVGAVMWSPLYAGAPIWYKILITALAALAVFKHRQNIVRLCKGTENRFAFTAKQRAAREAKLAQQKESK
jgi:glycerol-3-phosphate acyltransferase PlsY